MIASGDIWWAEDGEEEPAWVGQERGNFGKYRDRNQDGYLDKEEVANMLQPPGYDPAYAEAQHLLQEADEDKVSVGVAWGRSIDGWVVHLPFIVLYVAVCVTNYLAKDVLACCE